MVTREELIKAARNGNFMNSHRGSELVCKSCGRFDYEGEHEDNCPVGALLKLIEENTKG